MKKEATILFDYANFDWDKISNQFDFISRLKDVPQSPIHHGEGNVWIHTRMVVEELLNLPEFAGLTEEEKQLCYAACILHDIEKFSCTETDENGNITSPRHAKKGAHSSRLILDDLNVDFDTTNHISKLVRYHGLPLWWHAKPNSERAVIEASMTCNLKLLSIVAKADALGRICQDTDDLIYRIETFSEFAKELNCFDNTYMFESDLQRYSYFNKEPNRHYTPFEDRKFNAILLSGLPGAGKDTYIRNNYSDLPSISLDSIREQLGIKPTGNQGQVIQYAKEKAKQYMRDHHDFVWNGTNVTKQLRTPLIELFESYGGRVTIVYLKTDLNTLLQQNTQREAVVPENVILKLRNKTEIPDITECHKLIIQ